LGVKAEPAEWVVGWVKGQAKANQSKQNKTPQNDNDTHHQPKSDFGCLLLNPQPSTLNPCPPPPVFLHMHFRNATVNAIFDHGHNSFTLNWLQWMPSRSRNTTTPKYWGHYYFSYCLFLLLFLLTTPALAFPTDNHPPQTLAWVAFSVFVYASFEISMNCRCNRPGHGSCLRLMCYMCAGGPYPYLKPPYPWVMVHEPNRPQKSVECISLAVHLVSSRRRQS